jgi:hypothetical protein
VEHYKSLVSQILQLGIMTDRVKFEEVGVEKGRLTPSEVALWRQILDGKPSSN